MTEKKINELFKTNTASPSPLFSSTVRETLHTITTCSEISRTAHHFSMRGVLTLACALMLILPAALIPLFSVQMSSSTTHTPLPSDGECKLHRVTENLIVQPSDLCDPLAIHLSISSGLYHEPFQLKISSADPADTILYTIDGSIPSVENAMIYNDPITIDHSAVIHACVLKKDGSTGDVCVGNYLMLSKEPTVDVISLVVDPESYHDSKKGYTSKHNNIGTLSADEVEKIAMNGSMLYIPLTGNTDAFSRDLLLSRSRYYISTHDICYPQDNMQIDMTADLLPPSLFDEGGTLGYSACQLWNGGFDSAATRISNALGVQALRRFSSLDIIYPSCKPVSVYVNGDYIGQYWLKEVIGPEMIARKTGIPAEQFEGDAFYESVYHQGKLDTIINELSALSTGTDEKAREYLDENINIDSFLDWYTTAIYFGNCNFYMDAYREPVSGKWKFIAVGYDSAFFSSNTYREFFLADNWKASETLYRKIIAVDEYRELYLQKLGTLIQTITPEVLMEEVDQCIA